MQVEILHKARKGFNLFIVQKKALSKQKGLFFGLLFNDATLLRFPSLVHLVV